MIYLELFLLFFKLGLFSYGGGYAMIAMIQSELLTRDWVNINEFANIVAISQITPGPLGINAATYVGYTVAERLYGSWGGAAGSVAATFGAILPSFILILIVAIQLKKFYENKYVQAALYGIKPITVGLILSAAYTFIAISPIIDIRGILGTLCIFAFSAVVSWKTKLSVIWIIIISAILGIIIF